jgi:hypothetical protein
LLKKNTKGLKSAAAYGLIPNKLGFCGPQIRREQKILYEYLTRGENEREARKTLGRFEGACAYYDLIARKNKIKDIFDSRVVEAYWIGNKLLDSISRKDIREMIKEKFISPLLLSREEAEKRMRKISAKAKPHHSFHVLVLGSVTGRIDLSPIKLKDICRVGWGRVISLGKKSKDKGREAIVEYKPMVKNKSRVSFGKIKTKKISWDKKIIPVLKVGDWVSFHWNFAVQVLNKDNIKNLERYTQLSL